MYHRLLILLISVFCAGLWIQAANAGLEQKIIAAGWGPDAADRVCGVRPIPAAPV